MAIHGSVTLEDIVISFQIPGDNTVDVCLHDTLIRQSESYSCDGAVFFAALGLALQFNPDAPEFAEMSAKVYATEGLHQPKNPALRWIP
jgi:hypothetical protein